MFQKNQDPLPFDPEQARKILNSAAGKQLLQLLSRDGGTALQQAAAALRAGNVQQAQAALSETMQTEEAQMLVQQINREQ